MSEHCDIHTPGDCVPEYEKPREADLSILAMDTSTLAYLGDAIYELYIRKYLIDVASGNIKSDALHRAAVKYVNATAQAKVIKELEEALPDEERALVRRARNRKPISRPQHADPVDYKWATAYEALLAYYYLAGHIAVLEETIIRAINIVDA